MRRSLHAPRRKGMAIIMTLVIMAVLSVLLTVVTVQIVSQRNLIRQRHRQLQAEWLARSGVELAVARLLEAPAAFKEEKDGLLPDAKLRIVVEKSAKDEYSITVDAALGATEGMPVLRSVSARFRRVESDGVVRLLSISGQPAAKNEQARE